MRNMISLRLKGGKSIIHEQQNTQTHSLVLIFTMEVDFFEVCDFSVLVMEHHQ